MTKLEAEAELIALRMWEDHPLTQKALQKQSDERVNLLVHVLEDIPKDIEEQILREQSIGEARGLENLRVFIAARREELVNVINQRDKPYEITPDNEL